VTSVDVVVIIVIIVVANGVDEIEDVEVASRNVSPMMASGAGMGFLIVVFLALVNR